MTYDSLLDEASKEDIYIMENAPFESKSEGLINGDAILFEQTNVVQRYRLMKK